MTLVEKILALKVTPPFDGLRDSELELIAAAAVERQFAPGQVIHPGRAPLARFHLLVNGGWHSAAGSLPRTLGAGSLLFDLPVAGPITADAAAGALCLVISRNHFHTIATECPGLLLGYLAAPPGETRMP